MTDHSSTPSCIDDLERLAKAKLQNRNYLWEFIDLGTGDRQTLEDSKAAFKRFRFQPRILSAKREKSTWITVLGSPVGMPIGVAPSIMQSVIHPPNGDVLVGRGSAKAGAVMIYSSVGEFPIEEFGTNMENNGIYWAQTYLFRDRRNTLNIVRNAEKYGFKAIVVTVDSPVDHKGAGRNKETMSKFVDMVLPNPAANLKFLDGKVRQSKSMHFGKLWQQIGGARETSGFPGWTELAWLQGQTKLPIVLKGILTAEAARQAATTGICGIIVSAHGGRQLDGVPAPLDALPEVVDAVKDTNIEVYMDGGIRSGNDVLKALALGARAVFVGRPILWGLAVNGEEGVYQTLNILEDELKITMALCGCSSIKEITRSLVKHESQFHSKL